MGQGAPNWFVQHYRISAATEITGWLLDSENEGEGKSSVAGGLKKYAEWISRGRKTGRVAYVMKEWNLPEPKVGAEWAVDSNFNAAEELLRDPTLKDVIKSAIDEGSAIVNQND